MKTFLFSVATIVLVLQVVAWGPIQRRALPRVLSPSWRETDDIDNESQEVLCAEADRRGSVSIVGEAKLAAGSFVSQSQTNMRDGVVRNTANMDAQGGMATSH